MQKCNCEMPHFAKNNKGAELYWRLRNISYERMLVVNEMLSKYDLHYAQPPVLGVIQHHKSATQKELADYMNTSAAAMSATLKRMQKAGLVEKTQDKEDTRVNKITLTAKGEKTHEETFEKTMNIDRKMLEGFTEEEIKQLFVYLDRIHTNIENIGKEN